MDNNLILNFQSPVESMTLTFEDNGKVAYAYLKKEDDIIGDVWLYNHKSIKKPEWDDIQNAPFLNPDEYIDKKGIINKVVTIHDVLVNWEKDGTELVAYIYLKTFMVSLVQEINLVMHVMQLKIVLLQKF